jgi:hypothetical protein
MYITTVVPRTTILITLIVQVPYNNHQIPALQKENRLNQNRYLPD